MLKYTQTPEKFEVDEKLIVKKFEVVTCFEVLEPFQGSSLINRLCEIQELMLPSSILVLSVPTEARISGFFKNCLRVLLGQQHPDSSIINIMKSIFVMPIKRFHGNDRYIETNIGFNHHDLQKEISSFGFKICNVRY